MTNKQPSQELQLDPFERWLREVVGPTYDAFKADPSSGLSLEEVRASLKAHRAESVARRRSR